MATFTSIFTPDTDATGTVNTVSSSAEIVLGNNRMFAITGDAAFHIKFGVTGMAAASANNFKLGSGVIATYDTASHVDRIRIYNPGGSTLNYFIQYLAR